MASPLPDTPFTKEIKKKYFLKERNSEVSENYVSDNLIPIVNIVYGNFPKKNTFFRNSHEKISDILFFQT